MFRRHPCTRPLGNKCMFLSSKSRAGQWHATTMTQQLKPCFQAAKMLIIHGLITIQYSSWQLHLDTGALTFFVFFLVSDAPLRCRGRCREAKKTVACPALLKRGKENKFSPSKRKVTLGPIELFYNSINQSIRPLLTPRSIIKITDMRCTVQYSIYII